MRYFNSRSLTGPSFTALPGAARVGMDVDGFTAVATRNGFTVFVRSTGEVLPANRVRPAVGVFERFEVETVVEDGVIVGRPSAGRSGLMFAVV